MPTFKDIFLQLKHRNTKRFLLFLILTFMFLMISKFTKDYKYSLPLQITLTNLDDTVVIRPNSSLDTIFAIVEAKGFWLLPYLNTNRTLVLNSKTDVTEINSSFYFNTKKKHYLIENQIGKAFKLLDIKPDSIGIPFVKLQSKKVPVLLNQNISFASGYDIKDEIVLDSVKIIGTKTDLARIESLLTEPLNLSNINTAINTRIAIDVSKIQHIDLPQKLVTVKAEVVRFTEGVIELPIEVINKPDTVSINFFPKTITLTFYTDLESYNTITAADFKIICDYSKISKQHNYLTPEVVKIPKGVKRVGVKQKRIDYIQL